MFKHFQTRTQLLITHIFDSRSSTSTLNTIIRGRSNLVFGEMTFCFIQFRQNDVRANDASGKRRSAERRFVKMKFGWLTIRENAVRLNNDSDKCRSGWWSSANSTIRPCDDSVKWLLAIFFRQNNDSAKLHFGKTTIQWNDVTGKFCGPDECILNDYVPKTS